MKLIYAHELGSQGCRVDIYETGQKNEIYNFFFALKGIRVWEPCGWPLDSKPMHIVHIIFICAV